MDYINAFWVGGAIGALVQILMEKTNMLPGRDVYKRQNEDWLSGDNHFFYVAFCILLKCRFYFSFEDYIVCLLYTSASGDFTFMMGQSVQAAEQAMGTSEGLYAGVWIVSMNRRRCV